MGAVVAVGILGIVICFGVLFLILHKLYEVVIGECFVYAFVYVFFYLCLPGITLTVMLPFVVGLAGFLKIFYNGFVVFTAYPVTYFPDVVIAFLTVMILLILVFRQDFMILIIKSGGYKTEILSY